MSSGAGHLIAPTQAEASSGDGWGGAWSTSPVEFNLKNESRPVTTKEMIAGYEQFISQAHGAHFTEQGQQTAVDAVPLEYFQ